MFPAATRMFRNDVVCDAITPIADFDINSFAGTWYEQLHTKDPMEPSKYQCETAQYTNLAFDEASGAYTFDVYNSFQSPVFGVMTPRIGVHAKATTYGEGAVYVSFFGKDVPVPNLHVLETDYTTYAINYFCDTDRNIVDLWINTREPVVDEDWFQGIYARAMALAPSFDESTFEDRITQGDKCSYKDAETSIVEFLLTQF